MSTDGDRASGGNDGSDGEPHGGSGASAADATPTDDAAPATDPHFPLSRRGFVHTGAGAGIGALGAGGLPTASAQSATTEENLAEALQKSLYFFDANYCGDDVREESRLEWRGDCHHHDSAVPLDAPVDDSGTNLSSSFVSQHADVLDPDGTGTVDVSGGFHDAGDHVKFGHPQGYAASTLAWAVHEFEDAFRDIGSYEHALSHLRRFADYFMRCTFRDDAGDVVAFCHQVSNGGSGYDHNYWGPAELQTTEISTRPAYFATPNDQAGAACGQAAAGLAAIGAVFQGEDDAYAEECLDNAAALYEFADEYDGLTTYPSGFYDPADTGTGPVAHTLAWASLWLYVATGEDRWMEECVGEDGSGTFTGQVGTLVSSRQSGANLNWGHSWGDLWAGVVTKLAAVTDDEFWWSIARWHLSYWSGGEVEHEDGSGSYIDTTPAGFSWLTEWGSARYNAAAQFVALVYHRHRDSSTSAQFAEWALGQMEYIMGQSPIDYSLIVGYGEEHAEHPHHDTAHGSITGTEDEPEEHRHTLWGALVGGPNANDEHNDETDDYILNEVAIDFNAGLVGALAGHYETFGGDGEPVSPFPPESDSEDRLAVEAAISGVDDSRIDVSAYLMAELFTPARYAEGVSFRYYLDLGDAGSPGEVDVEITYDQAGQEEGTPVTIVGPESWDEEEGIYYVEFDYGDAQLHGEYELSFALSNYTADWFDPTTDPSYEGIPDSRGEADSLPLYVDGELRFGVEPDGTEPVEGPCVEHDPDAEAAEVDGQTVCDLNADGKFRDVNADGEVAQDDVVHFFGSQHRDAWKRPDLFDFSESESVGHGDVVALFEDVSIDVV